VFRGVRVLLVKFSVYLSTLNSL